jgi:hypothetical protein
MASRSIARNVGPALVAALGAAFVADLLTPLAPFASYLFIVAALICFVLVAAVLVRRMLATRLVPALVFSAVAMTIAGGLWQLQAQGEARNGVLADVLPIVRDLQRRIGIAQVDLTATREGIGRVETVVGRLEMRQSRVESQARVTAETTERTEQQVARVEGTVREVRTDTARIVATLDEVSRRFAAISRSDGLIADPSNPAEHYHNARLQEARGDGLGARRSYLAVAAADLDALDVYQRLATLVRVQDGRAGAREVFASLTERGRAPALALVAASLHDGAERTERLAAFRAAHPDYAAARLIEADDVSEARLGTQTASERRRERDALAAFVAAGEAGALDRHVLDPSVLGEWLESARRRFERLDRTIAQTPSEPSATFMRSNSGWHVTLMLPEAATELRYRLSQDAPFQPTGAMPAVDPRTGRPMPRTTLSLPTGREPNVIEVSYTDLRGAEVGPFALPFDPAASLVRQQRDTLEMIRNAWVAFRPFQGRVLVYYTMLVTNRCAIREARFGLDGAEPDQRFRMPACDPDEPHSVPNDLAPYVAVPAGTQSVRVRLTYSDGTTSEETVVRR